MRLLSRLLILTTVLALVCPGSTLSVGLGLDGVSRYTWRGISLSNGPTLQPSAWVSFADFTLAPWANLMVSESDSGCRLNEVDITFSYEQDIASLEVNPALALYLYPGEKWGRDVELGFELARTLGMVEIGTTHWIDVFSSPGAYFGELRLEAERDVSDWISVDAALSGGWGSAVFNRENLGIERWALNVVEARLGCDWLLAGLLQLRPHLVLSLIPDSELRQSSGQGGLQPIFGLSVEKEF